MHDNVSMKWDVSLHFVDLCAQEQMLVHVMFWIHQSIIAHFKL